MGCRRSACGHLLAWLALVALGCGGEGPARSGVVRDGAAASVTPEDQSPPAEEAARPSATERVMVLVPEGTFVMGWDAGEPDERPPHVVFLDAFHIDQFEVTVGQYRVCVEAGACEDPIYAPSCNWDGFAGDTHPINCMNRQNALDYCTWAGLRLPTEAEWRRAGPMGGFTPGVMNWWATRRIFALGPGRRPSRWAIIPAGFRPMGCTIWGGMCGSGWRTGMRRAITRGVRGSDRRGRDRGSLGCCGGGRGGLRRGRCRRRIGWLIIRR